jgi:hypothetical protein
MIEIEGLGGASFARALEHFRAGNPVMYRGMELQILRSGFECRVSVAEEKQPLTDSRALDMLTSARFRLGALLTSAPPLEAIVGNREPRLVLLRELTDGNRAELYELRGDRMRRLGRETSGDS